MTKTSSRMSPGSQSRRKRRRMMTSLYVTECPAARKTQTLTLPLGEYRERWKDGETVPWRYVDTPCRLAYCSPSLCFVDFRDPNHMQTAVSRAKAYLKVRH